MSISATKDIPHFLIDSRDRLTGDVESFDMKLQVAPNNTYDSCALIHAGIPRSYYNIDELGSFQLKENGVTTSSQLEAGEYTNDNIPRILKEVFDALSLSGNPTTPWTYNLVWNSFTFKWSITVTGHPGRVFNPATSAFKCNGLQFADVMGFDPIVGNLYDANGLVESTYVAKFQRTNYITIKSSICHNFGNNAPDSQILARIPVRNVPFGELIAYDLIQMEDGQKLIANKNSNVYRFGLYDDRDTLIFLNGRDWFMSVALWEYNRLSKYELQELEIVRQKRKIAKERAIDLLDPGRSTTIEPPSLEQIEADSGLLQPPLPEETK
jgi:hypothetical protein